MSAAMNEEVEVAFTTGTDYYDAEQNAFVVAPVIGRRSKSAVVPAVGLANMQFVPNREDYSAHPVYRFVERLTPDGIQEGYQGSNPADVYDLSWDVRLFHNRQSLLFNMIRAFQRHFRRQAFLFVPTDRTNKDGIYDGDLCELKARWEAGEDIREIGTFLEQEIPVAQGFTNTSVSNSDNLYVAETSVMIKQILLPDDVDLGFFAEPNDVGIDICDKNDPEQIVLATIDIDLEEEP
jgi:hypothetical protein